MMSAISYCWSQILQLTEEDALPLTISQYGGIPVVFKDLLSKIMAYLKDFYRFDIDGSYTEYVISELKYDDSDILWLDVD